MNRFEKALFSLIILFLPTQLGLHFWPKFSYIYSLKIDYLSPTLYFWDILVVMLFLVWMLNRPQFNKPALNLFLFFLFTQLLSLIGAGNIGAGLVRIEQYIISGFLGIYLASHRFEELSKHIYKPLMIGIIGESLLSFLQFIKGSTLDLWILGERTFSIVTPGIAKFDFYGLEFLRPYGTFPHPNVLAAYLLISIIILLFCGAKRHQNQDYGCVPLRLTRMTTVIGGFTIFLTMSRTTILAGLLILAFFLKRKWHIYKQNNWRSFAVVAVVFVLLPVIFTRFSSLFSFDTLTFLRREELIESSWQLFLKFPFFGAGLNNFIPAMAEHLISGPSRFLQPVHNIFLLTLSETGIIGLIGFLALICYPIKKLLTTNYSLPTFTPWILIIFLGMFDHYFLTLPQGYRLLFLVWGLSFSMLEWKSGSF